MKRSILLSFALLGASFVPLAVVSTAHGQGTPNWINYQGRLTLPDGTAVTDGAWPVTFRLFGTPTGGDQVWEETRSVTSRNGAFSTTLGQTSVLSPSLFSRALWLEIEVNGRKLTPRQPLGTVPFAMTALAVPGGAVTTVMLANLSITTDKIADAAITEAKLAPGLAIPIGSVVPWWGNAAQPPAGWAVCDGSTINDSASPLNGQALPDLRNRFIRGATGNVRTNPVSGGTDDHTLTVAEMPSHAHGVNDPGHSHGINDPGHSHRAFHNQQASNDVAIITDQNRSINTGAVDNHGTAPATTGITINAAASGISLQATGGGQSFPTVPRYAGLIFILRVR